MATAQIDITASNKGLNSTLGESEQLVNQFATGVKLALAGVAAAFVFNAIKDNVGGWIEEASKASDATAKLAAQIDRTGGVAGYSADQLKLMADEMEALTGVESEAIQKAQSLLLVFDNIRGEEFKRATVAANDLAKVMEIDVASAARLIGKALDDPVDAVNALAKAGVDFSEQEKEKIKTLAASGQVVEAQQIILSALEAKVGGVAEAMGKTFSGQLAIFQAKLGDVGEAIGTMLIPYLEALLPAGEVAVSGLMAIVDFFGELLGEADTFQSSFSQLIISGMEYVTSIFVNSLTYMVAFVETWSQQVEQFTYVAILGFVTMAEDTGHLFTSVIPSYLSWFSENWQNIFNDLASFTATVMTNMGANISAFFSNVGRWLSGENVDWKWTGLTEGFEATVKALPEIASRNLSETEKQLMSNIRQLDKSIEDTYSKRQAQGQAFVDKIFRPEAKAVEDITPTVSSKERRVVGKAEEDEKEKEEKDKAAKEDKVPSTKAAAAKEEKSIAGSMTGVEDLAKALDQAKTNEPQVELLREVRDAVMQGTAKSAEQTAKTKEADNASSINEIAKQAISMLTSINYGIDKMQTELARLNVGLV